MKPRKNEWTPEQCERLAALVKAGATPFRASVVLGRSLSRIKLKARELGYPFPHWREVTMKARQLSDDR